MTLPTALGLGTVETHAAAAFSPSQRAKHATDGTYRRDVQFIANRPGTRIALHAEKGITPDNVLKVPFRFQCPPLNEFARPLVVPWNVFETLSDDERSRPQGASLRQWQLDTLFVWDMADFVIWTGTHQTQNINAVNGCFEPTLFVEELEFIASQNAIFRLYAHDPVQWGSSVLTNTLATITGVTPSDKGGETGTQYVTVLFQQFRELVIEQQRRTASRSTPTTVKPAQTEDLYALSTKLLGKASDWRRIAAINGIQNVSPDNAAELDAWLATHHKTALKIPAIQKTPKRASGK